MGPFFCLGGFMDADLLILFSDNGRISEVSCKSVVVYFVLRADIYSRKGTEESKLLKKRNMLASALSIDNIAQISGFTVHEIKICIDELVRLKLVVRNDSYYQLGEYIKFGDGTIPKWYQLETKSQIKNKEPERDRNGINAMLERIRQRKRRTEAEERAVGARLSEQTKQTLIHSTMKEVKKDFKQKAETPTKILFKLFRKLHMQKFGKTATFATGEPCDTNDKQKMLDGWGKTGIYMLRLFKFFNEDMDASQKAIQFVFDNWDNIFKVMNLGAQSELTVGLLTSKWFMEKIMLWQQTGIPVWRLHKQPSKSNERINRTYAPGKADEDFGSNQDAGDSLPGDFG
jgi:hypothetical protein